MSNELITEDQVSKTIGPLFTLFKYLFVFGLLENSVDNSKREQNPVQLLFTLCCKVNIKWNRIICV